MPPECFPVIHLVKKSALSRRVSFARDVSIIDSLPLLFSPDTDLDTTERDDIQIATPTYVLFPGGDPFEDLNEISNPHLFVVIICCIYVAGLTETSGAGLDMF